MRISLAVAVVVAAFVGTAAAQVTTTAIVSVYDADGKYVGPLVGMTYWDAGTLLRFGGDLIYVPLRRDSRTLQLEFSKGYGGHRLYYLDLDCRGEAAILGAPQIASQLVTFTNNGRLFVGDVRTSVSSFTFRSSTTGDGECSNVPANPGTQAFGPAVRVTDVGPLPFRAPLTLAGPGKTRAASPRE